MSPVRLFTSWRAAVTATPLLMGCLLATGAHAVPKDADLILHNARVWTVDDVQPDAQAVAIRGNRIVKVGDDSDVLALKGERTRALDLRGKLVLPGFIDAHTHFENATGWFYEARLVDVNDETLLLQRLAETAGRVPEDMWITGYDWGAFSAAAARREGDHDFLAFEPSLGAIDQVTPKHPVLLRRHDGSYFINSRGMALLRIDRNSLDPSNGSYQRDPATGELTGMLFGTAGERLARAMPPPSRAQALIAAKQLVKELNRYGITGIHDIARVDAISQQQLYHAHVERSNSDLSIFTDLRDRGQLSLRVNPILTMANWRDYASHGIVAQDGDELIRYGAVKGFVDGFYMEEPYLDNPYHAGGLTFRVLDKASMEADLVGADRLGFDPAVHVIGDKAHRLLLDWYETAIANNPARDRTLRIVHTWFPSMHDIERAGRLGAVADITPYHLMREKNSIDAKLGPERARTAFAWRTMIDHGIRLNIVSDWPGSFDRGNIAPVNPMVNLWYAIARQDLGGDPSGGWRPEQALTIEEAIRAYTINPAMTSNEGDLRGSITEGKLADLVVLSDDILRLPPEQLPDVSVEYTIFDGRVVHDAAGQSR